MEAFLPLMRVHMCLKTLTLRAVHPLGAPGLSSSVVGKKHAFRLPERPEFVFEEEVAVRKRGWTENLQFYTGVGYLAGRMRACTSCRHAPCCMQRAGALAAIASTGECSCGLLYHM